MKNQFTDLYKTLPDARLLDILRNRPDYTPLAIETAEAELKSRNLSEEQLLAAGQVVETKTQQEQQTQQRREQVDERLQNFTSIFNPNAEASPGRSLKLVCAILLVISLSRLIKMVPGVLNYMSYNTEQDYLVVVFMVLDILIFPLGVALLWFRRKAGGILVSLYLIYSACISSYVIYMLMASDLGQSAFPFPMLVTELLSLLAALGILFFLHKKSTWSLLK